MKGFFEVSKMMKGSKKKRACYLTCHTRNRVKKKIKGEKKSRKVLGRLHNILYLHGNNDPFY